jgi:hypothetical protein
MELEELIGKKKAKGDKKDDESKTTSSIDTETETEDSKAKDAMEELEIDVSKIFVRYPSPATLNMTNLADAINQGQPVADFITETIATAEEEDVKGELKKRVIQDLMPQIHWEKYGKMLEDAKFDGERKKAVESTGPTGGDTPPADEGDGSDSGDASLGL